MDVVCDSCMCVSKISKKMRSRICLTVFDRFVVRHVSSRCCYDA